MTRHLVSRTVAIVHRWMLRGRRRRLSEAGYAAIMVALIVPTIGIGCAAVAVDTGAWYVEMQMTQKAADAAALAGVPYLPQDLPSAKTRALQVAARNGYDNATNNKVTVGLGEKATQLKVTISSTIKNTFGAAIGFKTQTITRTGVADYQGPAPMGSPCNTFGNEPNSGNGGGSASPTGTAAGSSPASNCSRTPNLWATVEGPQTDKIQGDRYQTKSCDSTKVDGCANGSDNDEYDEFGYVFVVKVQTGMVNKQVDLQLYDPMFVNTGNTCSYLPSSSSITAAVDGRRGSPKLTSNLNPYSTYGDAANRYSDDGSSSASYCTGDAYVTGDKSTAMTTSFVLRQQTDSQNPRVAPVQNDTSGSACIKQYGSYNTSSNNISTDVFDSSDGDYNADVGQTLHNWVNFCTFKPTRSGDYYLQVRTNVSLGGTNVTGGAGGIKSGNTNAAAATGNSTSGYGNNSFAIRAVTPTGSEKQIAVAGYNHMPIYINAPGATATFNLIRVLPGAAGQKISFSYYDAGDSDNGGSVTVVRPSDATGSILTKPFPNGCNATGGSAGTGPVLSTTCSYAFDQDPSSSSRPKASKNNGKVETITIPVPTDYSCNFADFAGCWYQVKVVFGSGAVHDVTTWDATVIGDPVRLIK